MTNRPPSRASQPPPPGQYGPPLAPVRPRWRTPLIAGVGIVAALAFIVAATIEGDKDRVNSSSDPYGGDSAAEQACSAFGVVVRDSSDGILNNTEIRDGMSEVVASADRSRSSVLRTNGREILALLTLPEMNKMDESKFGDYANDFLDECTRLRGL